MDISILLTNAGWTVTVSVVLVAVAVIGTGLTVTAALSGRCTKRRESRDQKLSSNERSRKLLLYVGKCLLQICKCLLDVYLSATSPHGGFKNMLLDGGWPSFTFSLHKGTHTQTIQKPAGEEHVHEREDTQTTQKPAGEEHVHERRKESTQDGVTNIHYRPVVYKFIKRLEVLPSFGEEEPNLGHDLYPSYAELNTYSTIFHPPKRNSDLSSLSSSQQENLRTLLAQMKPEEQDCLLRMTKQLKERRTLNSIWLFYPHTYISQYEDTLLSLLRCLHSIDRSNLLRLLEAMDPQEQENLIRVMDHLKESDRVELLGILDDLKALEQKRLLSVMFNTACYSNCELETVVLKLMKPLLPVDRSRLLRVLDELDSPLMLSKMIDEILDAPMRISEIIDRFKLQQQHLERVLDSLQEDRFSNFVDIVVMGYCVGYLDPDDVRLLPKADALRKVIQSYHWSSVLQCFDCLDPLEQKQLRRVLSELKVLAQRYYRMRPGLLSHDKPFINVKIDVYSMVSGAYALLMQMEYESLLQRLLLLFVCLLSIYLFENGPKVVSRICYSMDGGWSSGKSSYWLLEMWRGIQDQPL